MTVAWFQISIYPPPPPLPTPISVRSSNKTTCDCTSSSAGRWRSHHLQGSSQSGGKTAVSPGGAPVASVPWGMEWGRLSWETLERERQRHRKQTKHRQKVTLRKRSCQQHVQKCCFPRCDLVGPGSGLGKGLEREQDQKGSVKKLCF